MHIVLLRRAKMWSMRSVAKGTNIKPHRYNGIERGIVSPTDEERQRIAAFLKYPVNKIDFKRPRLLRGYEEL